MEEGGAEFEAAAAAAAADAMDGTEPGPSEEPVLDTLEERERFYQEVSSRLVILSALDPRKRKNTRHNSCALIPLARQGTRGGTEEGHCGGQDGRPAGPKASRRGHHDGGDVHGHVSEVRTVSAGTGKQLV